MWKLESEHIQSSLPGSKHRNSAIVKDLDQMSDIESSKPLSSHYTLRFVFVISHFPSCTLVVSVVSFGFSSFLRTDILPSYCFYNKTKNANTAKCKKKKKKVFCQGFCMHFNMLIISINSCEVGELVLEL